MWSLSKAKPYTYCLLASRYLQYFQWLPCTNATCHLRLPWQSTQKDSENVALHINITLYFLKLDLSFCFKQYYHMHTLLQTYLLLAAWTKGWGKVILRIHGDKSDHYFLLQTSSFILSNPLNILSDGAKKCTGMWNSAINVPSSEYYYVYCELHIVLLSDSMKLSDLLSWTKPSTTC